MLIYIFVFIGCLVGDLSAKTIPDYIPRCYRNDPNLDDCILKATETMRPYVIKGVPELGVPGVDPFVVPSVHFEQADRNLDFKMTLSNLTIHGLSNYNFSKLNFDPKTLTWTMRTTFDKIITTSQCQFDGKIFVLALTGHGTLLVSSEEPSTFNVIITTRMVKIKGVDHLEILNVTSDFPLVKIKARFENFEGIRPELVEAMNAVIEANSTELKEELVGSLKEVMYSFIRRIFKSLTKKVPYDELFPISDKFPQ